MKDKILHLMPDSIYTREFFSFIKARFLYENHYFLIICDMDAIKYISLDDDHILIREYESIKDILIKKDPELQSLSRKIKTVIIHYLDSQKVTYAYRYFLHKNIDLVWFIWGSDFYNKQTIEQLDSATKELMNISSFENHKNIDYKQVLYKHLEKRIFKKINYVSMLAKSDQTNIKFNKSIRFLNLEYPIHQNQSVGTLTETSHDFDILMNKLKKYKQVALLGNSGSLTNNHYSMMLRLQKVKGDFAILAPLSYGDQSYIKKIIEKGRLLFGDRFIPITTFLNKYEYIEILKCVDIAIWNHVVSEGFGNIRLLIELGKKIFYRKSEWSCFERFENMGVTYEDSDLIGSIPCEKMFEPYTEDIIIVNRKGIHEYYSDSKISETWDEVI